MSTTRDCFESFTRPFIVAFRVTNGKQHSPAGQRLIAMLTTGDLNGQVRDAYHVPEFYVHMVVLGDVDTSDSF
jgi:hypothetical protein